MISLAQARTVRSRRPDWITPKGTRNTLSNKAAGRLRKFSMKFDLEEAVLPDIIQKRQVRRLEPPES